MAHKRRTSVALTRLGAIALAGLLVLAACQLQTDSADKESQATVEEQVEKVITETVVVEREVERLIDASLTTTRVIRAVAEEPVSETPEPEEGLVEPAPEELDAAIRAVIQASNLAHVDALRTASIDPLLATVSGPWLQACERWVSNLRQAGLYAAIQLEDLEILSVGVLKPDERVVVATTIERWSEIQYRRQWDDLVIGVQPPALYYETYFMFAENGQWKIWDIQLDEQPFLTLVNVVGPVSVNNELAAENRVIHPGDLIQTASNGFASLIYSNGGVTHLGSDTDLELVELEGAIVAKAPGLARPLAQGRFARWRQWAGSTWNNVRRTVICSVAACSRPRETRFAVHVAADQSTSVEVFRGVVEVSSVDQDGELIPEWSVSVPAGEQTLVRPMEPPKDPGPIGKQPADLVITDFKTTGLPAFEESGRIAVPVQLAIRNQGDTAAGVFKVSIGYVGPMGRAPAPTAVPGQDGSWHTWTDEPLGPGSEIVLQGNVTFRSDMLGKEISLFALADSCAGDEYMGLPAYCRVEESDENNNESPLLPVTLIPPAKPDDCYPDLPSPQIFYSRKESIEGSAKDRHWIGISNSADYPDELFVPAPELPPCGLNNNASRTWVHVYDSADDSYIYGYCAWPNMGTELWFAAAEGEYKSVYISVEDRKCDIQYTSNSIVVP
jgi:hypothetical protein